MRYIAPMTRYRLSPFGTAVRSCFALSQAQYLDPNFCAGETSRAMFRGTTIISPVLTGIKVAAPTSVMFKQIMLNQGDVL